MRQEGRKEAMSVSSNISKYDWTVLDETPQSLAIVE
mgnify:CR=1 FL=1